MRHLRDSPTSARCCRGPDKAREAKSATQPQSAPGRCDASLRRIRDRLRFGSCVSRAAQKTGEARARSQRPMSKLAENSATQAAMDKLFGVAEPRANITRPVGDSNPGRNEIYSRALLEARERFPNDGVAQHRFAEREAVRSMQIRAAAAGASLDHSQKILVDVAFLEVFGGAGASLVATFPDFVIAR